MTGQQHSLWQRMLDVNQQFKEEAQIRYGQALQQQEQAEKLVARTEEKIEELNQYMASQQERGISAIRLQQMAEYAFFLQHRLRTEQMLLTRAKQESHRSKYRLLHYMKEEKKWSKLHQKEEAASQRRIRQKVQREMDDIAVSQYWRERRLGSEQV